MDGLELAARFTPGAEVEVGGDWYDAMPLPSYRPDGERLLTLMHDATAGTRDDTALIAVRRI